MAKQRLLIVDALNTFIRNWAVVPQMSTNGDHVGGVVGFLRSVKMMIRETKATKAILVWDGKGGSSKRRSIYSEYKAGRKVRLNREYDFGETPDQSQIDMLAQFMKAKKYADMLGLIQIEIESIEADDVIAYLCKSIFQDVEKIILSTDRDFLQLVDSKTLVYSPTRKLYFTAALVKEKHFVLPENFIYVKALTGDSSDNIKGIKGIGEKTAIKLFPFLAEHESSLDEIIEYAKNNINDKQKKYKEVYDSKNILIENIALMQLSSPIISAQSASAIRYALQSSETKFILSEVLLSFQLDGIQITDSDFFSVFKEYNIRSSSGDA